MERVTAIIDDTLARGLIPALAVDGFSSCERQNLGDEESYFGRTFVQQSPSIVRLVTVIARSYKDSGSLSLGVGVKYPQMDDMLKGFPYSGRDDEIGFPNFLVAPRIKNLLTSFEVGSMFCFVSQRIWKRIAPGKDAGWPVDREMDVAVLAQELVQAYHEQIRPWFQSHSKPAQALEFVQQLPYPLIEALFRQTGRDPKGAAKMVRKHIESRPEETQLALKWATQHGIPIDSDLQARLYSPAAALTTLKKQGFFQKRVTAPASSLPANIVFEYGCPGFNLSGVECRGPGKRLAFSTAPFIHKCPSCATSWHVKKDRNSYEWVDKVSSLSHWISDCGVCGAPLAVYTRHGIGEEGISRARCQSCGFARSN